MARVFPCETVGAGRRVLDHVPPESATRLLLGAFTGHRSWPSIALRRYGCAIIQSGEQRGFERPARLNSGRVEGDSPLSFGVRYTNDERVRSELWTSC